MKRETIEELLKDKLTKDVEVKEIINAIMNANGKDIEKLKAENESVKEKLKTAESSLKTFEGVNPDELNSKIKELTETLSAKDKEFAEKIATMEFDRLVDSAITKTGGKNSKAIKALLNITELKESKNQSVDIETALKDLKESDGYLFDSQEPINNPTGPTNSGGNSEAQDNALRAAMGLAVD